MLSEQQQQQQRLLPWTRGQLPARGHFTSPPGKCFSEQCQRLQLPCCSRRGHDTAPPDAGPRQLFPQGMAAPPGLVLEERWEGEFSKLHLPLGKKLLPKEEKLLPEGEKESSGSGVGGSKELLQGGQGEGGRQRRAAEPSPAGCGRADWSPGSALCFEHVKAFSHQRSKPSSEKAFIDPAPPRQRMLQCQK